MLCVCAARVCMGKLPRWVGTSLYTHKVCSVFILWSRTMCDMV